MDLDHENAHQKIDQMFHIKCLLSLPPCHLVQIAISCNSSPSDLNVSVYTGYPAKRPTQEQLKTS